MSTPTDEHAPDEDSRLVEMAEPSERNRSVTHALLLVLTAFLAGTLVRQLGVAGLEAVGATGDGALFLTEAVPVALHFLGFFLVCGGYLAWRSDHSFFGVGPPTGRDVRWILLGFSALVAVLVGFDVLLSQLGLEPADNVAVERGMEDPRLFLYFIPVVLLFNAPAEELLFRGLVQGLFRRAYGVVPGILAASLIFGLVHYLALVNTGSRVAYVGIAVLSGLVLGALYEYTDNLLVPVVVHAFWNILVYVNLYLNATGTL